MGIKSTFYDFSLNDGSVVYVTRNYAGLYKLRAHNEKLYEKSQILNKKKKGEATDDIENAEIIYAAYATAALMENADIMPMDDFLELMPTSQNTIANILGKLYGTGKKTNSPKPSENTQNE